LIIDTGSGDAIDDSSLVTASTTLPRYVVNSSGLGQSYRLVVGTLDSAWIGRAVLTRLPSAGSDVGIIGNAVWSRFTCTFDYRHRRLFLEPNETFGVAFDRGPESGIAFLNAPAGATEVIVSEVNDGSIGQAAGIRPRDIVLTLDGRPIQEIGIGRLTKLLNRRGSVYRLGLRRDGKHLGVTLAL
jgi:hypothetical protein